MAAIVNEGTQYLTIGGAPIVAGEIYIGDVNADPVANPKSIFSDRALSVALANPQASDAFGRSVNKIWTDGKFSIQVNDSAGVQQFQDLDAGESTTGATSISLDSVVGSNTITATGGITAYTSNQQFVFKTALANTGPVTLNVDSIGAKAVVKNKDVAINPDDFEINQTVIVVYNATNDNFEWTNQNVKTVQFSEGSAVASATTIDIWNQGGNTIHVTGTTGPISSFGTAPNIGARMRVIFDGVVTLTNSANLALPGGVDFTTEADDILEVYADTVTQLDIVIHKKDGKPVVATGKVAQVIEGAIAATTTTATIPRDASTPLISEGTEILSFDITPAINTSKVEIDIVFTATNSANTGSSNVALFRDSVCIAVVDWDNGDDFGGGKLGNFTLHTLDSPATASAITYSLRAGTSAGTMSINQSTVSLYNGLLATQNPTLKEIVV